MGFLRIIGMSLLLLAHNSSAYTQSKQDPEASTAEESTVTIEVNAEQLSQRWNKESIQAAAHGFGLAATRWQSLNDPEKASRALQQSARLRLLIGENQSALDELLLAVKLSEGNKVSIQFPRALSYLSLAFLKIGDTNQGRKYLARALEASQESGDKYAKGISNFAAGEFFYWQTENDRALRHYAVSEQLFREIGDVRLLIDTLISTAYIYMTLGNAAEGLRYGREAEELALANNYERSITISRIACGHLASFMNEKQMAIEYYSKAVQRFPDDIDFAEKGALFNGLGAIYEHYEELQASLKYRLQALENFRRDEFMFGYLSSLHSIIGIYFQLGENAAAYSHVQEARRLSRSLNDYYYESLVSRTIADHHFSMKEYDKAIYYYRQSLNSTQSTGYKTNSVVINNKLGQIYLQRNDLKLARRHFETALSLGSEIRNFFATSESFFYLAVIESIVNGDDAIRLAKSSIDTTEFLYADVGNSNLKRAYLSNVSERYEFYIGLLMKNFKTSRDRSFVHEAIRSSEQSRGRSLMEKMLLADAKFFADGDPSLVDREKNLQLQLTTKLDMVVQSLGEKGSSKESEDVEQDVVAIQNELEEVRAELKLNSPIYSAIKNPAPFDIVDFQARVLDEDSVLLQFSLGVEESYLWVVDKLNVTAYYLPPREKIEARVDRLRSLLASRQFIKGESLEDYQKRLTEAENEYKTEARNLSDELLGEAKEKLAGKKLIVVADGRLHYFPLGALPMPGSVGDEPILLSNEVVYSPSASALKILRMERKSERKPTKDLLVFADPVFSISDERIAGLETTNNGILATIFSPFRSIESLESMPRLPASEQEAISISDVVGTDRTTVRLGFDASRDGVLHGGIEEYKVLHFATHGLIDEKRPELSGILLSLYNKEGKQPDGGFIRLQDVYGLRLNSDLVVLSACDTGIGKEVKGEGLMSLNNAFLQAGAKSVVSSLWKVDDTATKDLMTAFYRGLTDDGLTAPAALRQAQIKMYNDPRYRSPFYWAAFTASGDSSVQANFASDTRVYGYFAAAFVLLSLVSLFWIRHYGRRRLRQS